MKLATLALASAFVLSTPFALATTTHYKHRTHHGTTYHQGTVGMGGGQYDRARGSYGAEVAPLQAAGTVPEVGWSAVRATVSTGRIVRHERDCGGPRNDLAGHCSERARRPLSNGLQQMFWSMAKV
jgi:hypothetical protein